MSKRARLLARLITMPLAAFALGVPSAMALELDWSGQFRAENHWVRNYTLDEANVAPDPARLNQGGYYVPGGGQTSAHFQTLFLRLRPKLIVNDNVYVKSEWWLGDPVFGFYGSTFPHTQDQRQFYSNQSRGSFVSAQRFWAEFVSDVGTIQVGRMPLHWGIGLVWNSGDGIWDRYQTTGDAFRLVSKFGAFSFIPSVVKYSAGNSVGGACTYDPTGTTCTPVVGAGGVSEYSLVFKYENADEDLEAGVNFVKRIAGAAQDPNSGLLGVTGSSAGSNFNVWDIYGRKKLGALTLAAEAPITSGDVGGISYKTFGLGFEGGWKISSSFDAFVKAGHAPGQPAGSTTPGEFDAFFFNPSYRLGLIMFNYQLRNFARPNTLNNAAASPASPASVYDNPIVNANYLQAGGAFNTDKWGFRASFVYARADETPGPGEGYFNTWDRAFFTNNTGAAQAKSLGFEMDYGVSFNWDDNFLFMADAGWFFPGDFFKFSNTAVENPTSSVFATVFRVGVTF